MNVHGVGSPFYVPIISDKIKNIIVFKASTDILFRS